MKILVLANFGMGLYKFRKELLETLIHHNHKVFVSLPEDEYTPKFRGMGCTFIRTKLDRRGTNPFTDLKLMYFYIRTIRRLKPDLVLTYTIKPNIYGGLACRLTNTPYLPNITGLGTSIENKGLISNLTLTLYKLGLKKAACVFFQNALNRQFFVQRRLVGTNTRLIPGSGVNLDQHQVEAYPPADSSLNCLFIGRMMKAKGVDELLEAAKQVKRHHPDIQFDLIGGTEENYAGKLAEYERMGFIKYHGVQDDVHAWITRSHVTILPSYHEGTANVLLESAAAGRPILASRVTGCVETFDEGVSGYSFQVKDADSLAETIIQFANLSYEEKQAMGMAGRAKVEREFDRNIVIEAYLDEINKIRSTKEKSNELGGENSKEFVRENHQ